MCFSRLFSPCIPLSLACCCLTQNFDILPPPISLLALPPPPPIHTCNLELLSPFSLTPPPKWSISRFLRCSSRPPRPPNYPRPHRICDHGFLSLFQATLGRVDDRAANRRCRELPRTSVLGSARPQGRLGKKIKVQVPLVPVVSAAFGRKNSMLPASPPGPNARKATSQSCVSSFALYPFVFLYAPFRRVLGGRASSPVATSHDVSRSERVNTTKEGTFWDRGGGCEGEG